MHLKLNSGIRKYYQQKHNLKHTKNVHSLNQRKVDGLYGEFEQISFNTIQRLSRNDNKTETFATVDIIILKNSKIQG